MRLPLKRLCSPAQKSRRCSQGLPIFTFELHTQLQADSKKKERHVKQPVWRIAKENPTKPRQAFLCDLQWKVSYFLSSTDDTGLSALLQAVCQTCVSVQRDYVDVKPTQGRLFFTQSLARSSR